MDQGKKDDAESTKGGTSAILASPALSTPPTLNLMEQLLLAKMEKQSLREHDRDVDVRVGGKKSFLLRRTDSMDSQTSASTFNSILSSDSASSENFYCKCDDCLLGIVDEYQRSSSVVSRKKVNLKCPFLFLAKNFSLENPCESSECIRGGRRIPAIRNAYRNFVPRYAIKHCRSTMASERRRSSIDASYVYVVDFFSNQFFPPGTLPFLSFFDDGLSRRDVKNLYYTLTRSKRKTIDAGSELS